MDDDDDTALLRVFDDEQQIDKLCMEKKNQLKHHNIMCVTKYCHENVHLYIGTERVGEDETVRNDLVSSCGGSGEKKLQVQYYHTIILYHHHLSQSSSYYFVHNITILL